MVNMQPTSMWKLGRQVGWQTVHFQLSKADTKTRTAYNSTAGREDERKRDFRGKTTTFSTEPFLCIRFHLLCLLLLKIVSEDRVEV